jgi:meso-butanediol dehydrogenase/(S,S)-butanediol dehydrogenase/diacetyl reductase
MIEQTGKLDTVVSNAGVAFSATLAATREEDWARVMRINLDGTFFTAKFTMPHLLKSRGTFTAVASDGGIQGAVAYAAYCASKHGVVGFVRCLALDHGKDGVRCNMVAPGFVETPMAEALLAGASATERDYYQKNVPMGRFARPDEVADAIAHLSSDQASYANGMVYSLDGGSTSGYYVAA